MELTILLILVGYIVFLHSLLYRKGRRIEKLVSDFTKSQAARSHYYRTHQSDDNMVPPEKLLEGKTHNFLLENEASQLTFIHYTRGISVGNSILNEGFRFVDSFHKTADEVTNDKIDLIYKHILHKSFGNILIVISIDKKLFMGYQDKVKDIKRGITPEQILTEVPPSLNDDSDEVFLLSNRFVKGYVNLETNEIVRNPEFNPSFNSPAFDRNIERLTGSS